ncbi:hypothetical protein [Lysobacter gummosus]
MPERRARAFCLAGKANPPQSPFFKGEDKPLRLEVRRDPKPSPDPTP